MAASTVAPTHPAEAAGVTSAYTPVAPCRVYGTSFVAAQSAVSVPIAGRCGVPAGASSVSLSVTASSTDGPGFVTLSPTGSARPVVSNLNYLAGDFISNGALVQLGGGSLDMYTHATAALSIDVTGYFTPTTGTNVGRFTAINGARVVDTRNTGALAPGQTIAVPLPAGVPSDAVAVAANITMPNSPNWGYATAWPAGQTRPEVTSVSMSAAGQTRAAGQIVGTTSAGFNVWTTTGGNVIVDITGYFTGPSALAASNGLFVPLTPQRVLDTRSPSSPLAGGGERIIPSSLFSGQAQALNVTMVGTAAAGFVTVFPANTQRPATSTINSDTSGQTVANMAIQPASAAGVTAFSYAGTHFVVDTFGYFTGPFVAQTTTPPPPAPQNGGGLSGLLGTPTSGNSGSWCASGLDSGSLNAFFSQAHGSFYGADYQRAYKLPDGRVLWMFQDAFITQTNGVKKLAHNVGMIQSGKCFSLLRAGTAAAPKPWIMWDKTIDRQQWYWPMGGEVSADGKTFHLMMAQMNERGATYLAHTEPTMMYVVNIRLSDLAVTGYAPAPNPSPELYGWSVTSDATYTYLYSNCYKQFGYTWPEDACTQYMKVARVPRGQLWAAPEYWNGSGWTGDAAAAVSIVSFVTTGYGINPGQVIFDGGRFVLIEKEGDWWGNNVLIQTSTSPAGPWTTAANISQPTKCGTACDTYFASWVPWKNPDGSMIWGLSHNRWDGAISTYYRPSMSSTKVS